MADQQDVSFFMEQDDPIMAPIRSDKIVRNNNPIFYNTDKVINKGATSKCLNILNNNKISSKLEINQQFFDFLAKDQTNPDMLIVSIVGPKKIGKSFLVDCLISYDQRNVNRQMTKNSKPLINISTHQLTGRNQQKILFFDCDGQVSNQTFLWTYFLSSVIVLNLNPLDRSGEEAFLNNISYVRSHLDTQPQDLTLPKLIVLRRDSQSNEFKEKDLLKRIQDYNVFQNDIIALNVSYPGTVTVKAKQILDVPQSALNKQFLSDISNIYNIVKGSKPKFIRGNSLSSKILSLTLDPLTKSINKDRKASTIRIWDDVIQTLSVGYYNYYITKYSQELQKQFQDQKPCDKYTLYRKLSSVKRKIDKKVQGFNNISGDPIFQKYREKLNEKILSKEKLIKQINKQKSRNQNNQYCKKLFKQMDDSNCARLIQEYCKSDLDDEKTQVLLENFQAIINQRIKDMQRSKDPTKKPSKQIQSLEEELKKLDDQIKQQKNFNVEVKAYDFQKLKSTINTKEKQLKDLQKQLEKQKQISNTKKTNQNKDIVALEKNIQQLKQKTQKQEKQMQQLRAERQKKVKIMTKQLEDQLKKQEEKLTKLQELVKKAKQSTFAAKGAQQGSKDNSCCIIM